MSEETSTILLILPPAAALDAANEISIAISESKSSVKCNVGRHAIWELRGARSAEILRAVFENLVAGQEKQVIFKNSTLFFKNC